MTNLKTRDAKSVEDFASIDDLEEYLSADLQNSLANLELLEEDRKKISNPTAIGDVLIDEVWNQVSNQFGLEVTKETLIQKYDREHQVKDEVTGQWRNETYADVKDKVIQDSRYKEANKAMKEQQECGKLVDKYTGKKIAADDKANLDHVKSRKEIYDDPRRKQANLATEDLANMEANLQATNESLNKSKGAKSVEEYLANSKEREKDLKAQYDRNLKKIETNPSLTPQQKKKKARVAKKRLDDKLAADAKKMREADKKARDALDAKRNKEVAKNIAGKVGVDFLKQVAVESLFTLLRESVNAFVRWIKSSAKSFASLIAEMKKALTSFFSKWWNIVRDGAKTAIGTIVFELLGPIASTFKRVLSLFKQSAKSILDAIEFLGKESKGMPFSLKMAHVGKIITAGLVAGGAITLTQAFESILMTIPVLIIPIPVVGKIATILSVFLASLTSGIVGAVVINKIDKWIAKKAKEEKGREIVAQQNDVLSKQIVLTEVLSVKVDQTKEKVAHEIYNRHQKVDSYIEQVEDSLNRVGESNDEKWADMNAASEEVDSLLEDF